MIVSCTRCRAKFRVADEKIGPRGAKVRCSHCQTVFVVQLDAGGSPPNGLGTMPAQTNSGMAPAPATITGMVAVELEKPDAPRSPPRTYDPFAASYMAVESDASSSVAPRPDGLELAGAPAGRATATLPVTSLSDLLAPPAPPPPAVPPPLPPSVKSTSPGLEAPPAPSSAQEVGLSLEERATPQPMKIAAPERPLDLATLFGPQRSFEEPDPFAAAGYGPSPAESQPAGEGAGKRGARPPTASSLPRLARQPTETSTLSPAAVKPVLEDRIPGKRSSRLRVVAVNSISLAALLLLALGLLAVWRAEGPLEASSLRPLALLRALSRGNDASGPFSLREVRSGVYERRRGPPLLFVRGQLVSLAPAPVAAARVSVDVVRGDRVLAHGEAIAGALPTPEELFEADDEAALARAAAVARGRAPAKVEPGEAVPFLVAVSGSPADLEGASMKVVVAPVVRGSR